MYGDALTTKARVKSRIDITSTEFDDFIDRLILGVTSSIQQMTGRRFNLATYTHELHDGSDVFGSYRNILLIKNAPVQEIDTIEYKQGLNSNPTWTAYDEDDYDVDLLDGMVYMKSALPRGFQNIRITYTGGFSGYSLGVGTFWAFNITPTGTVNGVNATFTLPEAATQVIVYADGVRLASANVSFTTGGTSFSILNGLQPYSTIAVDYSRAVDAQDSDLNLPADLVEVCEVAVVRKFKRRQSEGRTSESFSESSITWMDGDFTDDELATIKNYRRGYNL